MLELLWDMTEILGKVDRNQPLHRKRNGAIVAWLPREALNEAWALGLALRPCRL